VTRIDSKIVLIDGETLAQLMIDHGLGVVPVAVYEVKRIDSDYFADALPEPAMGTAQLYSGQAEGLLVRLPDWPYPIVIDPATGTIRYDNYGSSPTKVRDVSQRTRDLTNRQEVATIHCPRVRAYPGP